MPLGLLYMNNLMKNNFWSKIYDLLGCYDMHFGRQVSVSWRNLLSQYRLPFYSESWGSSFFSSTGDYLPNCMV